MHFEELWTQCETFHQEASKSVETPALVDGLMLKVNLYKALASQDDMPNEEMQKVKTRTLGEIVLTLTALSLKDNINVFEALNTALQMRSVDFFNKKHPI